MPAQFARRHLLAVMPTTALVVAGAGFAASNMGSLQ
jgi:hypothetical protein